MSTVAHYEITLAPTDLQWLRRHTGTHRCFPADLRAGSGTWPIWVGYRGCSSRWFRKPSFDLWFADERRMDGHARLHLNAAYRDPSLLRSRLAMELFTSLGVPAPRAWHCWLAVNGQPLGLYLALESIDAAWLRRQGHPEGAIYYAVGTQGDFQRIHTATGKAKRYLAAGYEKCYPCDDDFADLVELVRAVALTSDAAFVERIDALLDVETFLRWLIGVEFVSHTDGLIQNYALYRPAGGRWSISPWDCDGTFGRIPDGRILKPDEMPVGTGDDNNLAARLLRTERWRGRYRELWAEMLRTVLTREAIVPRLAVLYREIRPYARRDFNKRLSNTTFAREPARIRRYIAERTAVVRGRLSRM